MMREIDEQVFAWQKLIAQYADANYKLSRLPSCFGAQAAIEAVLKREKPLGYFDYTVTNDASYQYYLAMQKLVEQESKLNYFVVPTGAADSNGFFCVLYWQEHQQEMQALRYYLTRIKSADESSQEVIDDVLSKVYAAAENKQKQKQKRDQLFLGLIETHINHVISGQKPMMYFFVMNDKTQQKYSQLRQFVASPGCVHSLTYQPYPHDRSKGFCILWRSDLEEEV